MGIESYRPILSILQYVDMDIGVVKDMDMNFDMYMNIVHMDVDMMIYVDIPRKKIQYMDSSSLKLAIFLSPEGQGGRYNLKVTSGTALRSSALFMSSAVSQRMV